ncbi:MAG: tRNA (guanosine(37)-N1)-methyltransferase TrmD [Acidimicrobiia bacterium]|nr:tRNA (guanosine(37)-N1)-methyltransferase TrmD [Acidimicrobiia bacterium]
MTFHLVTIFPEFFSSILEHGVVGRAIKSGAIQVRIHNLRDWTQDRHKTVDDRPFGGGEGMLMKPEPVFEAVAAVLGERRAAARVVLMSAQGKLFDQAAARRLSECEEVLLICGRYEGVDERVAEHLADEEISVGDYVLSGGELAAALVMDAVGRLVPGVVGNADSTVWESFRRDEETGRLLLDCPQFTRPAEYRGWKVPEVLLTGNHEQIRRWRLEAAREKTARNRPDLVK